MRAIGRGSRSRAGLTDDSREQTRRVFASLASIEDHASLVDFEPWHALQTWLAAHPKTHVVVPFMDALASVMPDSATRLRRDFATLLSLVRAHAVLHRAQREQDDRGRLVATLEGDYAPVRELVSSAIAETVDATVSTATRETIEAIRQVIEEGAEHATASAVTARLEVGRSASYDRINRALASGYLTNLAGSNGATSTADGGSSASSRRTSRPGSCPAARRRIRSARSR